MIAHCIPFLFPTWVISIKRYWVTLAKHRRLWQRIADAQKKWWAQFNKQKAELVAKKNTEPKKAAAVHKPSRLLKKSPERPKCHLGRM
jgi:hypothetical protein